VRAELAEVAGAVGLSLVIGPWPDPATMLPGASEAPIVVSTVPAAASAPLASAVPGRPGVLLDVSYAPWPPPLAAAWRSAGGRAASGEEMLLHQAVEQVELMTGRRPGIGAMRSALLSEIARRSRA
jgi:shikimate dehydrogenase